MTTHRCRVAGARKCAKDSANYHGERRSGFSDGGEVFSPGNSNEKLRKKRILAIATV